MRRDDARWRLANRLLHHRDQLAAEFQAMREELAASCAELRPCEAGVALDIVSDGALMLAGAGVLASVLISHDRDGLPHGSEETTDERASE